MTTKVLVDALFLLRGSGRCEHTIAPVGACFKEGRTPNAEYLAERCCVHCVADKALRDSGHLIEIEGMKIRPLVEIG